MMMRFVCLRRGYCCWFCKSTCIGLVSADAEHEIEQQHYFILWSLGRRCTTRVKEKMMEENCSGMVHMEIHHSIFVAFDRWRSHSFRFSAHLFRFDVLVLAFFCLSFQLSKIAISKSSRDAHCRMQHTTDRAWILDVTSRIKFNIIIGSPSLPLTLSSSSSHSCYCFYTVLRSSVSPVMFCGLIAVVPFRGKKGDEREEKQKRIRCPNRLVFIHAARPKYT